MTAAHSIPIMLTKDHDEVDHHEQEVEVNEAYMIFMDRLDELLFRVMLTMRIFNMMNNIDTSEFGI